MTVHTSAGSLYRAILADAADSGDDDYSHVMPDWRPAEEGEMADYTDFECHDVRKVESLQERARGKVAMHGCEHPGRRPDVRVTYTSRMPDGVRSSMTVRRTRARLLALADTVRIKWALFGGGPVPADLVKPKAARRVSEFKPGELRLWADMIAEKQYADALDYGAKLGAIYYPGTKERPIVLAGPQPVAGLPDGIVSGMRGHDREYVVFHLASGRSIGDGARTRKGAESNALQAVADSAEKRGPDVLEKAIAAAPVVDTAAAREEWRKAHGIIDLPESALDAAPNESADEWAARMVAQVAQPVDVVAHPEELDESARAAVYGVHCKTAAVARKIAPDALADGVRLRRSVNEPGFDAASMALRRSVAQAMRAARRGPVAQVAPVAPVAHAAPPVVQAAGPVVAPSVETLRAALVTLENRILAMAPARYSNGAHGSDIEAAARSRAVTPAMRLERKALKDAIRAATPAPAPAAAPAAPVAHAAPPVVQAAPPVVAPSVYVLPDAKAQHQEWCACESRKFTPNPRQLLVMAAVSVAIKEGAYYTKDVLAACVKSLCVSDADQADGALRVEGGTFGMECYYARKTLDALKHHAAEDAAALAMALQPGQKLPALMFNDFKLIRAVSVESVTDGGMSATFIGSRGSSKVSGTCSALQLQYAIERAAERAARRAADKPTRAATAAPQPAPAPAAAPASSAPPVGVSAPPVMVSADPDAAMMRKAAERAQVLADGIKAAAGDDPATMARMLKSEAARIMAAALGMPARIAASYRATADMLEYAAELHADALARDQIPARQAQPGMRAQATARRPRMARCGPLARHWRTAPSMARRPWCQARHGPAAPRMLPPAAAPPVMAFAPHVAKFLGIN